jgi:hypothetical protein
MGHVFRANKKPLVMVKALAHLKARNVEPHLLLAVKDHVVHSLHSALHDHLVDGTGVDSLRALVVPDREHAIADILRATERNVNKYLKKRPRLPKRL